MEYVDYRDAETTYRSTLGYKLNFNSNVCVLDVRFCVPGQCRNDIYNNLLNDQVRKYVNN